MANPEKIFIRVVAKEIFFRAFFLALFIFVFLFAIKAV